MEKKQAAAVIHYTDDESRGLLHTVLILCVISLFLVFLVAYVKLYTASDPDSHQERDSLYCFSAFASWSGQEVGLGPQWIPSRRLIASSTSIPSIRR